MIAFIIVSVGFCLVAAGWMEGRERGYRRGYLDGVVDACNTAEQQIEQLTQPQISRTGLRADYERMSSHE